MKLKGPITFGVGKLPQQLKDHIKKYGIKMPFQVDGFFYKNDKIDDWFRIKEGKKKYKMDRKNKKMIEDKRTIISDTL